MPTVYLHIGLMKSGTSYVQRILSKNKSALMDAGVLFPGRRWRDQVAGVEDVLGATDTSERRGPWTQIVNEIVQFDGDAVLSMESLAVADSAAVERVVSAFPDRRVRVIATARDLGRVVPAQWQESLKNGADLGFPSYLKAISLPGARRLPAARFFWALHDLPKILQRWAQHVDAGDLVLVTVPPSGAPPTLFWQRFSEAAGIHRDDLALDVARNESMGSYSAELLRRLNGMRTSEHDRATQRVIKQVLAKQVLVAHKDAEPPIALPDKYRDWASRMSRKLVDQVNDIAPLVIGDLNDLLVAAETDGAKVLDGAPVPSEATLNEAALTAILGLVERLERRPKG
jgi:hypothetical protein